MFRDLVYDAEGNRGDVRACQSSVLYMERTSHTRNDHLRWITVVIKDCDYLAHEVHAVMADVIEPTDKGAHIRRAHLGGEQSLRR
jgi:hypothetical protein